MNIVIMGASSGGIEAWKTILPNIASDIPAAFILLQHQKADSNSSLPQLLNSFSSLPICIVEDGMTMLAHHIYFAPANYHLLVNTDHSFSLDTGPLVNFSRPAIDTSMMSAASVFKELLIGILLSGASQDGALGMKMIKQFGGTTIVEDPKFSATSYMPEQAIKLSQPDHLLKKEHIASRINAMFSNQQPSAINRIG